MLEIVPRILLHKIFRRFGHPKMMPMSMVFVTTYKCNSRCKTCNIWKVKDFSKELQLWEYERIFHTVGKPLWVTIGGGEPFLKRDFADIVEKLCEICSPRIINIPTNGSLYRILPKAIERIIDSSNGAKIILNISLDGVGNKHDKIRGFPGNFDSTMKTIYKLKKIESDNFTLGIHSVISKFNSGDFKKLYDFVEDQIEPGSFIVETAQNRREYFNLNSDLLNENYIENVKFFVNRLKEKELSGIPRLIKSFRLLYYNNLLNGHKIPCYAGWISCQINPYGDIWVCATKGWKLGNLRKNNYDFRKIWLGKRADKVRQELKHKNCFCPLANVAYTNMLCDFNSLMKVIVNSIF